LEKKMMFQGFRDREVDEIEVESISLEVNGMGDFSS
jgi:hypothetical protein